MSFLSISLTVLTVCFSYLLNKIAKFVNFSTKMKPTEEKKRDFSKLRYEPVSKEEMDTMIQKFKENLKRVGFDKMSEYDELIRTLEKTESMLERAELFCNGKIRSNGYFSIVKLIYKFMDHISSSIDRDISSGQDCASIKKTGQKLAFFTKLSARLMELMTRVMDEMILDDEKNVESLKQELLKYPELHRNLELFKLIPVTRDADVLMNNNSIVEEKDANSNSLKRKNVTKFNSSPLFTPKIDTVWDCVYEAIAQPNTPNKEIIYQGSLFMFWIDKGLRTFLRSFITLLSFLKCHFYQYPQLIFDSNFRTRVQNRILSYPTLNIPLELLNLSDFPVYLWFMKFLTRHLETKTKELQIPIQTSIEILPSVAPKLRFNDVDKINFSKDRTIRCKYIKPTSIDIENCERLIIHFHGGGFLSQHIDSHEPFLKHWVAHNKIPILTVDYRIRYAFPVGLQDCFDAYVWLRTAPESEIRNSLGFYPKKIVINGDSAGGNLGFAIALILNDLRTEFKSDLNLSIPMPDGLVMIYTPFVIQPFASPSRALSVLDTLVPLGVQLVILYCINGFIPDLKPNSRWEVLKAWLFPNSDTKSWFECPKDQFKEQLVHLLKLPTSPYLNPLFYDKFDTLKDVPLCMITAEYDSFLDDSIMMGKIFKGPVKVDVIEGMCHGFLLLYFVSENVKNANIFCAEKIEEIFEEADAMKTNE